MKALAIALALASICFAYCVYSSDNASPKATALAAITCSSGPPCCPGNTAKLITCDIILISPFGVFLPQGFSKSLPKRMIPPRGPRKVLWVVEVTIWAYSSGLFSNPAAIRPAGCAMSIINRAPTLSAISRIRL